MKSLLLKKTIHSDTVVGFLYLVQFAFPDIFFNLAFKNLAFCVLLLCHYTSRNTFAIEGFSLSVDLPYVSYGKALDLPGILSPCPQDSSGQSPRLAVD